MPIVTSFTPGFATRTASRATRSGTVLTSPQVSLSSSPKITSAWLVAPPFK